MENSSNNQEIQLCKFIVNLWTLVETPPDVCAIYQRNLTNEFEHASISEIREAWWNPVVDNFEIELSAELCVWSQRM